MDDKLPKCGTEPMNADHFIHLHWPSHDKIKMLLIEVVKERDEQWRAMSGQAPGLEAMRPTGRELRLVNGAISLLNLLRDAPGLVLSDSVEVHLDELDKACGAYKAHMLKPEMKRHTQLVVRAALQAAERGKPL